MANIAAEVRPWEIIISREACHPVVEALIALGIKSPMCPTDE